jgi:serine protease Do
MKKLIWIALASFFLGVLLAGYIFVYLPEKHAETSFLNKTSSPLGANLYAEAPQVKPDLDFVKVSEKLGPAVIKIESERVEKQSPMTFPDSPFGDDFWDRFFGRQQQRPQEYKMTVQGTGFFISNDGYILTNNHLVERASKVKVFTVQGDEYTAKVIGTDPRTDVALIKVDAKNLPFAEFGDSGLVKIGEWVLAIGNPLGMEHTVTAGIVSAKGRQLDLGIDGNYEDFIQTDAAINRGNSGGPLVNMKGEVIGITSNILTPTGGNIGIGFAIPSNMAKKVVTQLKEKGRVIRGWLGVTIVSQPIDQDYQKALNLKSRKGAIINDVTAGSPADKAGIKQYDVVTEVNGKVVENPTDLRMKIADIQPGTKVEIKLVRDGQEKTVTAAIAELEAGEKTKTAAETAAKNIGITVSTLTPQIARRYGLRTTEGLLVTDIENGSDAERKGIQPSDIILEVNRQKITTVSQWESIMRKVKTGDALLLLIRREQDGQSRDAIVTIRIP